MIKFFRNIRQKLLIENNTGKYLKYALGEIILVVIGILIALSINNWNENKKNIHKEQLYLKALYEELIQDTKSQNEIYRKLEMMENGANYIMNVLDDPSKTIKDTLEFCNKFKYMMAFDQQLPKPVIWHELQSTGNMALIRNRSLIKQLYAYYFKTSSCEKDFNNNAQPFINRARHLDSEIFSVQTQKDFFENWKVEKTPDKKVIINILESKDIYKNTKGIVTGMLVSKKLLNNVIKESNNLIESIKKEL